MTEQQVKQKIKAILEKLDAWKNSEEVNNKNSQIISVHIIG